MSEPPSDWMAPLRERAVAWESGAAGRPLRFAAPDEERRAVERSAVAVLPDRALLAVTGADRVRFLNGYVTCDVAALAPGRAARGFLTDRQGRVLADTVVMARQEDLLLDLPRAERAAMEEHLARFRIADRVDFAAPDLVATALLGGARDLVDGAPAEIGDVAAGRWAGGEGLVVRWPLAGVAALVVWAPEESAGALLAAALAGSTVPVGAETLDLLRVEHGEPRFGQDYGSDNFPQETGVADAVSFTKGCYLGQEVVARIHYRGGVNRHLRRLRLVAGNAVAGEEVLLDGRPLGRLTTWAPGLGEGLAIVHRRGAEPGTLAELAGGGRVEVLEPAPAEPVRR